MVQWFSFMKIFLCLFQFRKKIYKDHMTHRSTSKSHPISLFLALICWGFWESQNSWAKVISACENCRQWRQALHVFDAIGDAKSLGSWEDETGYPGRNGGFTMLHQQQYVG